MSDQEQSKGQAPSVRVGGPKRPTRIGLLGCGVVGSAVAQLLLDDRSACANDRPCLELKRVAVRHPDKKRPVALPATFLTTDVLSVATDPDIDVVVELIGDVEPARTAILAAFAAGKHVVTANKELLASTAGEEIFRAAIRFGTSVGFEGSIGGAVPLVRTLSQALAGDRIRGVTAVLNGTTNYILTKIEEGYSFQRALQEAQSKGFAEADPVADLEGLDAAAKAALIATICFGRHFHVTEVDRLGISAVTELDVEAASRLGYSLRLLASVREVEGAVSLRVQPTLLPKDHPLARLRNELNGFLIDTDSAGKLYLEGAGAGGIPTASAVLGDVVSAARSIGTTTRRSLLTRPRHVPSIDHAAPAKRFIRLISHKKGWQPKVRRTLDRNLVRLDSSVTEQRYEEPLTAIISSPIDNETCTRVIAELIDHDIWPVSIYPVGDAA